MTLGPAGHAVLGGSVAEKWITCAGYKQAVTGLPESPPSKYTVEGDNGHALVEHCLLHGDNPKAWIGKPWLKPKPGFAGTYTDELVEMVGHCITAVMLHFDPEEGDKLYLERPIVLSSIDAELWGSSDVIIVKPSQKRVVVIDHKFGAGKIVDPVDNAQGAFYVVGSCDDLQIPNDWRATFGIMQPRIDLLLQTWDLTPGMIAEWRGIFRRAWRKNNEPDAPRTAGEHCHWCKRDGNCYAQAERQRLSVRRDFASATTGPADPQSLSLEQRGNLLRVFPEVEAWIEAVRAAALADAVAGHAPVGYHVIEGRKGARAWADEAKATQVLEAVIGDEAYTRKLITPTAAEKALGKGIVDGLVVQPPGKPALAPLGDGKDDFGKQNQARAEFTS